MLRPRPPDDGLFGYGARFVEGGPQEHDKIGVVHGSTLATESGAHYLVSGSLIYQAHISH